MEVERRLVGLQRQADASTEGIKALTNTTYKRVDEHASAIQKLTLVRADRGGVKNVVSGYSSLTLDLCWTSFDTPDLSSTLVGSDVLITPSHPYHAPSGHQLPHGGQTHDLCSTSHGGNRMR